MFQMGKTYLLRSPVWFKPAFLSPVLTASGRTASAEALKAATAASHAEALAQAWT